MEIRLNIIISDQALGSVGIVLSGCREKRDVWSAVSHQWVLMLGWGRKTGRRTARSDVVLFQTFILRLLIAASDPPPASFCIYFGFLTICDDSFDAPLLL